VNPPPALAADPDELAVNAASGAVMEPIQVVSAPSLTGETEVCTAILTLVHAVASAAQDYAVVTRGKRK
jgi:hypothetical protein